jgi:deoxyribose-phosphate aldolase
MITKKELAKVIDHTYLKIQASDMEIKAICYEAINYGFAAVAVHPVVVPLASRLLRGTKVKISAAISFFSGLYPLKIKLHEIEDAISNGATELDMVMSLDLVKEKKYDLLEREFKEFAKVGKGLTTKIILETCLLTNEEKIKACELAKKAGIDFVKTSTGFKKAGATIEDVKLMRKTVGQAMGVKAAGGIRNWKDAVSLIEAGADRLGTSCGVDIVESYSIN